MDRYPKIENENQTGRLQAAKITAEANRNASAVQPKIALIINLDLPVVPKWGGKITLNNKVHCFSNTCPIDNYLAMFACEGVLAGELVIEFIITDTLLSSQLPEQLKWSLWGKLKTGSSTTPHFSSTRTPINLLRQWE